MIIGKLLDKIQELGQQNHVRLLEERSDVLAKLMESLGSMSVDAIDYVRVGHAMEEVGFGLAHYEGVLAANMKALNRSYFGGRLSLARRMWATQKADRVLVEYYEQHRDSRPAYALDIGCGDGTNSIFMATQGTNTLGIDISSRAIGLCRRRFKAASGWKHGSNLECEFAQESVFGELLGQRSETFDFVLDRGCLHHIPPQLFAMYRKRVLDVLKPGGRFLLLAHAPQWGLEQSVHDACLGPVPDLLAYILSNRTTGIFSVKKIRGVFEEHFEFDALSVRVDPHAAFHTDVVALMRKK